MNVKHNYYKKYKLSDYPRDKTASQRHIRELIRKYNCWSIQMLVQGNPKFMRNAGQLTEYKNLVKTIAPVHHQTRNRDYHFVCWCHLC